jgi:hypothetical protein
VHCLQVIVRFTVGHCGTVAAYVGTCDWNRRVSSCRRSVTEKHDITVILSVVFPTETVSLTLDTLHGLIIAASVFYYLNRRNAVTPNSCVVDKKLSFRLPRCQLTLSHLDK